MIKAFFNIIKYSLFLSAALTFFFFQNSFSSAYKAQAHLSHKLKTELISFELGPFLNTIKKSLLSSDYSLWVTARLGTSRRTHIWSFSTTDRAILLKILCKNHFDFSR